MRFTYCPDCGGLLGSRILGDEGAVPWCEGCGKPWFDMFSTCVIGLVADRDDNVLLLRQSYISDRYANLVSGYMTPGESAEECMRREILEETGIAVDSLQLEGTWWFAKKQLLMIGFTARTRDLTPTPRLSTEVDAAEWHPAAEAVGLVHPTGSVSHALLNRFIGRE